MDESSASASISADPRRRGIKAVIAERPLSCFFVLSVLPAALLCGLTPFFDPWSPYAVPGLAAMLVCWAIDDGPLQRRKTALRLAVVFLLTAGAVILVAYGFGSGDKVWGADFCLLVLGGSIVIAGAFSPRETIRDLVRPMVRWRMPSRVLLLALLAWPIMAVLVGVAASLLNPTQPGNQDVVGGPGILDVLLFLAYAVGQAIPWTVGWFGFGARRLTTRHSPLVAGLVIGAAQWLVTDVSTVAWLGHAPSAWFAVGLASTLSVAVVEVWLFCRSRGSLLPILVLEATRSFSFAIILALAAPTIGDWFTLSRAFAGTECLLAVLLILAARMWRRPAPPASLKPAAAGEPALLPVS